MADRVVTTTAVWRKTFGKLDLAGLACLEVRHAILVSPLASIVSNGSAKTNKAITHPGRLRRWSVPPAMAIVVLLGGGLFVQGQVRYHQLAGTTTRLELLEGVRPR